MPKIDRKVAAVIICGYISERMLRNAKESVIKICNKFHFPYETIDNAEDNGLPEEKLFDKLYSFAERRITPNDYQLVWYVGHGDGNWVLGKQSKGEEQAAEKVEIHGTTLFNFFSTKTNAYETLIVTDACGSGQIAEDLSEWFRSKTPQNQGWTKLFGERKISVFYSAGVGEKGWGTNSSFAMSGANLAYTAYVEKLLCSSSVSISSSHETNWETFRDMLIMNPPELLSRNSPLQEYNKQQPGWTSVTGKSYWKVPDLQTVPPFPHNISKPHHIDAVYKIEGDTKLYFLTGDSYIAYDFKNRQVVQSGKIQDLCNGLWKDGIDAIVNWGDRNRIFFFKGNQYMRYDYEEQEMDIEKYPRSIAAHWTGLWPDGVDAAVEWLTEDDDCIFFFKDGLYTKYDRKTDKVPDTHKLSRKVTDYWNNWPSCPHWKDGKIDAAVNLENGHILFFRGNQYLSYDIENDCVEIGYPKINALII